MESLIMDILNSITIPLNYKRANMSGIKRIGSGKDNRIYGNPIRSVTMGVVRDWKTGGKMVSTFTKHNEQLWELLCEYGQLITDIPFTSICINHNTIAEPHQDKHNQGVSCIVGIGNYTGGELVVFYENGEKIVDIHNKPYTFDGSKYIHWSLPFEGNRYSLIFFVG